MQRDGERISHRWHRPRRSTRRLKRGSSGSEGPTAVATRSSRSRTTTSARCSTAILVSSLASTWELASCWSISTGAMSRVASESSMNSCWLTRAPSTKASDRNSSGGDPADRAALRHAGATCSTRRQRAANGSLFWGSQRRALGIAVRNGVARQRWSKLRENPEPTLPAFSGK